jgi:glycosyltransferase involved in cell wall biosynthesis
MRQRLLYITPVMPATTGNGLAMRAGSILEALSTRYKISLLVVQQYSGVTPKLPPGLRSMCDRCVILPAGAVVQPVFRAAAFDCIHVFRLASIPFLDAYVTPSRNTWLQLDLDDIESKATRRLAILYRLNGCAQEASRLDCELQRLEKLEEDAFRRFHRVFVCSRADQQELQARTCTEIAVLPNTIRAISCVSPRRDAELFRFLFVGSLGVYANEDAVLYFCEHILPLLRRQAARPFTVDIVGSFPSARLRALAEDAGARVIGPVADVRQWYQAADAVIVPLRTGGGTRIKILEAFSYRRPVVTTTLGAEGLGLRNGAHALVADRRDAFADACASLMNDRILSDKLVENAANLLRDRYTMATLQKTIASFAGFPVRRRSPAAVLRSWSRYIFARFDHAPVACGYPGPQSLP